jgi:predicted CoA-substrate-specific enzyme activase
MIIAGCDIGSLTAKALIMNGKREIMAYEIMTVLPNPLRSAEEIMSRTLKKAGLGLELEEIDFCVSTGYGREQITFAKKDISEISCHGKGAHWTNPDIRTIIDIGGQDLKVIRVDKDGELVDFIMNDKCAAGTGRFLEGIAQTLKVKLEDLGDLALSGQNPVTINSICTVYTQFDVMHLIVEGAEKADIAAGVAQTMATRMHKLLRKVGIKKEVVITGGVAKNQGVIKYLEEIIKGQIFQFRDIDPQIMGALGAALFAREEMEKNIL